MFSWFKFYEGQLAVVISTRSGSRIVFKQAYLIESSVETGQLVY